MKFWHWSTSLLLECLSLLAYGTSQTTTTTTTTATTTEEKADIFHWSHPGTPKPTSSISVCNEQVFGECLLPGLEAMPWGSAHNYCRSKDGYLLTKGQLDLASPFWPPNNITLSLDEDLQPRDLSPYNLTWIAITLHNGHYQWLSQFPAVGQFVLWMTPQKWEQQCAGLHLNTGRVQLVPCSIPLMFFCYLPETPVWQDEYDINDIELRVTTNVEAKDGWVEVLESDFPQLYLTCAAYHKQSGERLNTQPPIFWSKDGVYLDIQVKSLFPSQVHDATKSDVPHISSQESHFELKQGTFWCESWVPKSPLHLESNKLLVTLKEWVVLIFVAKIMESCVNSENGTAKLRETFKPILRDIDNYSIYIVSIEKNVLPNRNKCLATYRFQVHIPMSDDVLNNIVDMFQNDGQKYKRLYAKDGYLNTSSVHFGTFCQEQNKKYQYGNEILWPFTKASKVNPKNYKCRTEDNKLLPGICRWNYTHGAFIDFDPSVCQEFEFCPSKYTGINRDFCVSVSRSSIWEVALKNMYKTIHEKSILDTLEYFTRSNESFLYEIMKDTDLTIWLPIRRIIPYGPLEYMGPGHMSYLYKEYNYSHHHISWGLHQPKSDRDCVALNLTMNHLLTLDCNTKLPSVSLLNISGLEEIPNTNWISLMPHLITKNPQCPEGWDSTGLYTGNPFCFKLFVKEKNTTWKSAQEFCRQRGASLPTPGIGFLDWVFRQYIYDKKVPSVWMKDISASVNKLRPDFLNWKASSDYTLQYSSLYVDGWEKEGEEAVKSSILCQKKIVHYHTSKIHLLKVDKTERSRRLKSYRKGSGDVCLEINNISDENLKVKCHINGRYIFPYKRNTSKCHHVLGDSQGYYECHLWTTNPPNLVKSNIYLNRDHNVLTFAVSLLQNAVYDPSHHDSTFIDFSQEASFSDCVVPFINFLKSKLNSIYISASNFFFSPGLKSDELLHNFNIEMTKKDRSILDEYDMLWNFSNIFANDEPLLGCKLVSIQSTIGCIGETKMTYGQIEKNLSWPTVEGNKFVLPKELCINNEGEPVTRKCNGDFLKGYHWGEISDGCNGEPSSLTKTLWNISQSKSSKPSEDLKILSNLTANGSSLMPADIHFVASKLQSLSITEDSRELELEEVVETLNNVMEADDVAIEAVHRKLNTSGILFEAFENITFKVKLPSHSGDQAVNVTKKLISVERLDLEINSSIIGYQSLDQGKKQVTLKKDFKEDSLRGDAAIIFPENLTYIVAADSGKLARMQSDDTVQKVKLTFAVYRTPKLFQDPMSFPNYSVCGDVIQASYDGKIVKDLTEPVTILFKHSRDNNDSKCVYWDFKKNDGIGGWSTEGCWKGSQRGDYDVCFCNHLTCFARLINYNDDAFDHINALVLDIITIIGCSLSIVGLLMVFTTFCLFKKWRRSLSNKILVNLSLSVFCSLVIFLAGINQTWNLILCRSIAVSLHYFILASFGWMLVEAVHQYLKFVKVVGTYIPRFLWKASVSAWGVPIFPIIVVLVYDSTLYDGKVDDESDTKICWMSSECFMYAFLPPLALTMLVNLIMFFLIIHGAVCGRARVNSTLSERSLFMSQLSMAVCVFFLLGFTWIFGLLSIWKARLLFSYLFCIFNTLQGFFIFLFHICRERSVRRFWKEFLSVITKVPISVSDPVNSNHVHSTQGKGRLDSVTYNQGGGILVLPRRTSTSTVGSLNTISTVVASPRGSFSVRP